MILLRPSVEFEIVPNRADIYTHLERAARTCYQSEGKIEVGSAEKLLRKVIERGHESVIEHASVSVRLVCDRGVTHELVRHRLVAYSQESTRYCRYEGHVQFIIPPWVDIDPGEYESSIVKWGIGWMCDDPDRCWMSAMSDAELHYHKLLKQGWTPQQARSVLPNSLKTEIVATANIREWRHILRLRCSKAAHPQMREVMLLLREMLIERLPVLFEDVVILGE